MTYAQFANRYLGDELGAQPFSTQSFYVGHVALLDKSSGTADVIEALDNKNVRRTSYSSWLKERQAADVWHGRLTNATAASGQAIARQASKYLGRRYDFWNFDLADETGFYCSKLVWLSVFRATGIALDNDDTTQRLLWYSPKQCMNSPHVEKLFSPSPYTGP